MNFREFHYRWKWDFTADPESLWPLVSDTNRYNRDVGAPDIQQDGDPFTPSRFRKIRFSYLGIPVEYTEEPFEWFRPYRFSVYRRFDRGPVEFMRIDVRLTPRDGGGTHVAFEVTSKPRTIIGILAIPLRVGLVAGRNLGRTFHTYDELISSGKIPIEFQRQNSLVPGGRIRLWKLRKKLLDEGVSQPLLDRLVEIIDHGDDLSLARLRPYTLADYWHMPRRQVLELCLLATRAGLLTMQWNILCPLCRGTQQNSTSLNDLHSALHCDSCNIDFSANFDRLVELTFKPNPSIRQVEERRFCVGGPQVTPHIVVQQRIAPQQSREITPLLQTGRYRLRTYGLAGGQSIAVSKGGASSVTLRSEQSGWPTDEIDISPSPVIRLENTTEVDQVFVLERMEWTDQAATAAEVTALQKFRDLFSNDVLRPGEQFSVGSMTFFFTDLKDSTRFYRQVGDAPAFGYVVNHFDILREAITEEGGTLVKTMGDAVMAAFVQPAAALRALLKAQRRLAAVGGERPLWLKAGVHTGTCIAVTLNNRLDYFGTTVNITARLQGLSQGGDIVVSEPVREDPEVADFLDKYTVAASIEPLETQLKGLEGEYFRLWRMKPNFEMVNI